MKKFAKVASGVLAVSMVLSMTALADETWKIGGIGPVTGGAAVYGQAVKNAMELAINEINEAGGINGYQVEAENFFQDDEHDAEKSVNAYNTLKDWGMDMLLGTVTSKPCQAVADLTAEDSGGTDHIRLLHRGIRSGEGRQHVPADPFGKRGGLRQI